MATIAVGALMVSMGVPGFQELVQDNRLTAETNQFIAAMRIARSEAIKRKTTIDVAAITSSDSTNEWGGGWSVSVTAGDTLKNFQGFDSSSKLDSDNDIASFQYQPSGRTNRTDTLYLCDDIRSGETGRQITIATTGRVTVADYVCS